MNEQCCNHSVVSYRNKYIYMFGGFELNDNYIYKSSVERYDPQQNSWFYVASMHQPQQKNSAFVYGDKIFLIGEHNPECVWACEIYDPVTDKWQMGCFQ